MELDCFVIDAMRERQSDNLYALGAEEFQTLLKTSTDSNRNLEHYYDNFFQKSLLKVSQTIEINCEDLKDPDKLDKLVTK